MGFLGFTLVILGVLLVIAGTLLLAFLGTGIPLLVLAIRRRRGHRSRASKIAMIVLGVIFGLTTLMIIALAVFLVWATTPS